MKKSKKIFILLGLIIIAIGVFINGHQSEADIYNPVSINSSTISSAGVVLSANNGQDFASTSTTLTNLGGASTASNNNFTGSNTFATTTVGNFFCNSINGTICFPSPAQLSVGAVCGNAVDTEAGRCFNDINSAASSSGLAAIQIDTGPYNYASDFNTPVFFTTKGLQVMVDCVGGGGTEFQYGGTATTSAFTFSGGNASIAGWGMTGCHVVGSTSHPSSTLITVGGINASDGFFFEGNYLNFNGNGGGASGTDMVFGNNVYATVMIGNFLGPAGTVFSYQGTSNAGEGLFSAGNDYYNFSGAASVANCFLLGGSTLLDVKSYGDHFDNCEINILQNAGNVAELDTFGDHLEDPLQNTGPTYSFGVIATSTGRNVWKSSFDTFLQDATQTVPTAYVSVGGDFVAVSPTISKLGSATTTSVFVSTFSSGATVNVQNPIAATLGANQGTSNIVSGSSLPVNYQNGASTYVSGGFLGLGTGGATPTSTLDVNGSFACGNVPLVASATVAISGIGAESGGNLGCSYAFNGSTSSTLTLPPLASSTNRIIPIVDRNGTANLTIQATSSQLISFQGSTATSLTLLPGTSVTLQNIGSLWIVISANGISSNVGFPTSGVSVSACGTGSPTISGSNNVGAIVSGSSASACTVTFASPTYKNPPVCTVSDSNTSAVTDVSAVSSSSVTFSLASALSAVNIYYSCWANPN